MLLDPYHRLPYFAKVGVASARGLYLRSWRYGRATGSLVREAIERERWSAEDWDRWQAARVTPLLHQAASRVPHYLDLSRELGPGIDELASWPVLTKDDLRRATGRFLAEGAPRWRRFPEHSSGTSGSPLTVWFSRRALIEWYALLEARCRRWHGVSLKDRWAILGGQLVAEVSRDKPPYWVWNAPMSQLYLSSYHLGPTTAEAYATAIEKHRITYVWGYASAMASLAGLLVETGRTVKGLRVALSNAEPLLDHQREVIERAFDCPARDTYGMAEMVTGASECERGRMHLWPEVGIVEVLALDSDDPVPPGSPGRLVCTGLLNDTMPLIRYEVGDLAALEPPETRCPCGRALPMLRVLEGRSDDLVITTDGRLVGRLDPVFKADLPIREAQIVQEAVGRFRILVAPSAGWGPSTAEVISRRLQDRVGPASVDVEVVDAVPRGPGGKLKAVVSHVVAGTP